MKLRKTNSIEQAHDLCCGTCLLREQCSITIAPSSRQMICEHYCNPGKGYYDDSGAKKVRHGQR